MQRSAVYGPTRNGSSLDPFWLSSAGLDVVNGTQSREPAATRATALSTPLGHLRAADYLRGYLLTLELRRPLV